jgi:hypothetical protein
MNFSGMGFMACVEACPTNGEGSSCPLPSGGRTVKCNGMDQCVPSMPNDCTP